MGYLLVAFGLFSSAVAIFFYLKIVLVIAFSEPSKKVADVKEAPKTMLLAMWILAALCIIIGVYPAPWFNLAQQVATAFTNFAGYIAGAI
jgi:NADH-quinone oxidoreductase subunit N